MSHMLLKRGILMNKIIKIITLFFVFYFCLSCVALAIPQNTHTLYANKYDEGYDDGYDDGYEEAQEEFENMQEQERKKEQSFRSSLVSIVLLIVIIGISIFDR